MAELARQTLRDRESLHRVATTVKKIEGRSGIKPEPARVAHGQTARVEQFLGTAQGFRRGRECEEPGDRTDLEIALAPRALDLGVVEEVRRRLLELLGHVLERTHRRTDLPELDGAHMCPREVRCSELRLRQASGDARLAQPLTELAECRRKRSRTPASRADSRHRGKLGRRTSGVNPKSTACDRFRRPRLAGRCLGEGSEFSRSTIIRRCGRTFGIS